MISSFLHVNSAKPKPVLKFQVGIVGVVYLAIGTVYRYQTVF